MLKCSSVTTIFLIHIIYAQSDRNHNIFINDDIKPSIANCNSLTHNANINNLNSNYTCNPKWFCCSTTAKHIGIGDKLKRHFFDIDTYKERIQISQTYYNLMQVLEHEGTYFVYTYSLPPFGIYGNNLESELKFQVSLKVPLWRGAFWSKGSLFFGYTQTVWFQQFNYLYSNPVRDTNYKPSIFYSYPSDWKFLGGRIKEIRIGYLHFSNGIGGDECIKTQQGVQATSTCRSRSLGNRIMLEGIWEIGNFGIHITAWPYIPYRRDNPDISDYIGYANMRFYYKYNRHFAEVHIEPIISNYVNYHGSIQIGYAYSISKFFAIYGQYFYGYGNSLYEYNIPAQRIGIGLRAGGF